jgi:hypothetical protein
MTTGREVALTGQIADKNRHELSRLDGEPLSDFELFAMADTSSVNRTTIETVALEMFGTSNDSSDLRAKLVDNMLSVNESRDKIVKEFVSLGGNLSISMMQIRNFETARLGDTVAVRRKAATLCFDFFEKSLHIKRGAAYQYMRCHQRFGDNAEALRVFNLGELNMLTGEDVTDRHVATLIAEKLAKPKMTREELRDVLDLLKKQDELIDDKSVQIENMTLLLEESKLSLEISESESHHLREQLTLNSKALVEKENALAEARALVSKRSAGFSAMEKDLADKNAEVDRLTREYVAKANEPAKIEIKEVTVEKVPEAYVTLSDALDAALADLKKAETAKALAKKEAAALEADVQTKKAELEASKAVQVALQDVIASWEPFAGKFSSAQLAVQASKDPEAFKPTLQAIAATLQKFLGEINAAL